MSTEQLTDQLLRSYERTTEYANLSSKWRDRGRPIKSAQDLVERYYETFSVVAIPARTVKSPPTRVAEISSQIKNLYKQICIASGQIQERRVSVDASFDVATLNKNLETTLQLLGKNPRFLLDFHSMIEGDSKVPLGFSQHMAAAMFNLAKARKIDKSHDTTGEKKIVADFIPYLASSIVAQLPSCPDEGTYSLQSLHIMVLTDDRCHVEQKKRPRRRSTAWVSVVPRAFLALRSSQCIRNQEV